MLTSHQIDDVTLIYQTNCLYTKEGQIIVARKLEADVIFYDVSRGIYGQIKNCEVSAAAIQDRYLNNDYTSKVSYQMVQELGDVAILHRHMVPCTLKGG